MKKWPSLSLVVFAFFLAAPGLLRADVKDWVFLVKPIFHEKTRALFLDLAKDFGDKGSAEGQRYFTALAGEHAFGSGWVVVDADGQNYIITNRHVVIGAEKVNIYIEDEEGAQKAFLDCPILYVDGQMDLAVAQFPGAQKVFKSGFKLDTRPQKDLTEVVAAGFPGFGGEPLWQVSMGNITNSRARIDPSYSYLIQHSAPIDPGNSGGPLLVKDPTTPLGYAVAGVNTLKALKRESTNFAIPSKDVAEVLEKAKKARKLVRTPAALKSELVRASTVLAGELASDTPVDQAVNQYISYAMVGEKGWEAYRGVLKVADDQKQFTEWFLDDPVEAMRTSIYWCFRTEVENRKSPAVTFVGINPADVDAVGTKSQIRTTFTIGGTQKEIAWTWEYGQWRISNMALEIPQGSAQGNTQAQPEAQVGTAAGDEDTQSEASTDKPVILRNSVVGVLGAAGAALYYGASYTGMLFPDQHWGKTPVSIGLSAAVGGADDGSFFVLGGPAIAIYYWDLVFPLRFGIASTPYGTTFIGNLGVIFKIDVLALSIDFGYVIPGSALVGAGLGINF